MGNENSFVSIACISFNQEKHITQAIDGMLLQLALVSGLSYFYLPWFHSRIWILVQLGLVGLGLSAVAAMVSGYVRSRLLNYISWTKV